MKNIIFCSVILLFVKMVFYLMEQRELVVLCRRRVLIILKTDNGIKFVMKSGEDSLLWILVRLIGYTGELSCV